MTTNGLINAAAAVPVPPLYQANQDGGAHNVHFYEDQESLIEGLSSFIGAAVGGGDAAVIIATPAHRTALAQRLQQHGLNVALAAAQGRFILLDAAETLAAFMTDEGPDAERFADIIGNVIRTAATAATSDKSRVAAFGEMVAILWEDGKPEAAIHLEQLWNELAGLYSFELLCAYPIGLFSHHTDDAQISRVFGQHLKVVPTESYTALLSDEERNRSIALLQQKALALETEIRATARLLASEQQARALAQEQAYLLETLHQVGNTIARELDLEQLVQAVTDAATELSGAQFGAFFYNAINDHGEVYTLATISGVPRERFANFPMPRNTKIFGPTFQGAEVVRLDDVTQDPRYGQNAPYYGMPEAHLPVRSYLAVPVVSRSGEVLGGLFFGHEQAGVFTQKAESLVMGVAGQAAIAIDNARLFQNLQRALQTRDDFLAAAHDLKTPLAGLKGIAQLLQRQAPAVPQTRQDQRLVEGLRRIDTTATKMASMIAELLDVARLEMDRPLELDLTPVDLVRLVQLAVDDHQPTAPRHPMRIETEAATLLGQWDALRLGRVLDNLISNAVKFSPDGSAVVLQLESTVDNDGRGWAIMRITDHGIGIPEDDHARIFERFQRARNVVGRIDGTGIGLAGAQRIVQRHGGRIAVASQEGAGSTFTVRLPLVQYAASNNDTAGIT